MTEQRKVRTCFWFTRRGVDAAQFYVGDSCRTAGSTPCSITAAPMIL